MKASPIALLAAAASLALAVLTACGGGDGPPPIEGLGGQAVTYDAEDGVRIVASWYLPSDEEKPPVVMLFHEEMSSRDQWESFVPVLLDKGYAVLAPDLRGFGQSTTVVSDGNQETYEISNYDDMLLDVAAALNWLSARSDVDLSRIAAVGAKIGGNLAFVSTAVFPELKTAVALSPTPYSEDGPLVGNGIENFLPHDVFFMAGGRAAWIEAVSLAIRVAGAVDGGPYADQTVQGVALLERDDVRSDFIGWLEEHL